MTDRVLGASGNGPAEVTVRVQAELYAPLTLSYYELHAFHFLIMTHIQDI